MEEEEEEVEEKEEEGELGDGKLRGGSGLEKIRNE